MKGSRGKSSLAGDLSSRQLPGLHGLRHRLSRPSPVRPADRGLRAQVERNFDVVLRGACRRLCSGSSPHSQAVSFTPAAASRWSPSPFSDRPRGPGRAAAAASLTSDEGWSRWLHRRVVRRLPDRFKPARYVEGAWRSVRGCVQRIFFTPRERGDRPGAWPPKAPRGPRGRAAAARLKSTPVARTGACPRPAR